MHGTGWTEVTGGDNRRETDDEGEYYVLLGCRTMSLKTQGATCISHQPPGQESGDFGRT